MKKKIHVGNEITKMVAVCIYADPYLIANQDNFGAKYMQNGEENWTKK